MGEVVTIQIGGAGVNIGNAYWKRLNAEHGLDEHGIYHGDNAAELQHIETHYVERGFGNCRKYKPRSILIDNSQSDITWKLGSKHQLTLDDAVIIDKSTSNVYSRGFHMPRKSKRDIMEKLRLIVESADHAKCFQFIHSISGGTGSGTTAALIRKIDKYYGHKCSSIVNWCILPSEKSTHIVVEPYNALLCLRHLVQFSHNTYVIDNEALHRRLQHGDKVRKIPFQVYDEMNDLASLAIANCTASTRFPGQQSTDFSKMHVNLVPYPILHFFSLSVAPLPTIHTDFSYQQMRQSVPQIISDLFQTRNIFTSVRNGFFLSGCITIRGEVKMSELDEAINAVSNEKLVTDTIARGVCDMAPPGMKHSSVLCSNHSGVADAIERLGIAFRKLYQKRSYCHWFERLNDMDYRFAERQAFDLIRLYRSTADQANMRLNLNLQLIQPDDW